MRVDENGLKIDVGIITVKPEEFSAITSRLGDWSYLDGYKHYYVHQSIKDINELQYNVVVARSLEPGTGSAQSLTADMIKELNPTWLFLVGIAGGVPAPEYSLGDVLLCTRLHDFSVCCIHEDSPPTFAISGGSIHQTAAKLLEGLPAHDNYLETHGWNSITGLHKEKPTIDLNPTFFVNNLYGDESWKQRVIDSLKRNFSEPRKPKYYLGATGSSNCLVKSASLLDTWLDYARGLTAVEMELAGVYRAAQQNNTPVLAIRSLSDIVGYKRSPEWTQFACESAASFAICLIKAGLLRMSKNSKPLPLKTISVNPSVGMQTTQEDGPFSLPYDSPFYPYGTIPLNHQSYIIRDSDTLLEKLLSSASFICLHGENCCGKSSLLIRTPKMLKEWNVFRPMLELYQNGRRGTFERNFFAEMQCVNKDLRDWISMGKFLNGTKGLFLIDEIGKCSSEDARMFIERLYALVDHVPHNNIRVVLTIQKSLDLYIGNIGLDNPRYHNCWEKVEITKFTENELIQMLAIFPPPVERSLLENLSKIKKYTLMEPNEIQKFCDDLWKHLREKEMPIREINQDVNQYINKFRKDRR